MFFGRDTRIVLLLRKICCKRVADFFGEIENCVVSAFARYDKGIVGKVDAFVVQTDQLGNTDSRSEKQRQDRAVSDLRFVVIAARMGG